MTYGDPIMQYGPSGGLGALKRRPRRESGIMDAFTRHTDLFGGTIEYNIGKGKAIDTEVADAMKGNESYFLLDKIIKMAEKGEYPTRDMFQSDAEYRYVVKRYNDVRNYIENKGTSAFKKASLGKEITSIEDMLATAQSGYGIGLEELRNLI